MISGYPPFYSQNRHEIPKLIAKGNVSFKGGLVLREVGNVWKTVDKNCVSLIKKMLAYDMNERISAACALQEPWIKNYANRKKEITDEDLLISLNNLKNFRIQTLFQAAVLSYITSQQMSKEQEARIREIFDSFDKDGNGELTKEELLNVLRYMHGDCKRIYKEAEEIFRNIDLDNNGTIEYNGKKD